MILRLTVVLGLASAVGVGVASAQPQPQPQPAAQTAPPPADPAGGLARQVNLTPAEQLQQADASMARMEGVRTAIRRQLEAARAQRDVVKSLCLNDKLNQVDVAIRSARERRQALELAANRKDADLTNHEATILGVLRQRVDQLSAEANQCIGQEAGFVGDSSVTSTVDPNLPQEDPSEYPDDNGIIVEPPACSSCFQ
ncbi:MAG: hypothetical protein WKG00_06290 [Polyangiaceae bacterium]